MAGRLATATLLAYDWSEDSVTHKTPRESNAQPHNCLFRRRDGIMRLCGFNMSIGSCSIQILVGFVRNDKILSELRRFRT